jgi:hypothetical protein
MTQTMQYLAEARGALGRAAHSLRNAEGVHRDSGAHAAQPPREPTDAALAAFTDSQLLGSTVLIEEISRELDVFKAVFAGEVAWRSRPELGNAGLAAMEGHLNPESLLRSLTRSSFHDAARRIRVGTLLAESEASTGAGVDAVAGAPADAASSGFAGVGPFDAIASAVLGGEIGVEGADRVIRALAPVADSIAPDVLRQATSRLAMEGATCNG